MFFQSGRIDPAHRGPGIASGRTEGREIVLTDQAGGSLRHPFKIETFFQVPAEPAMERGADLSGIDRVAIPLGQGAVAGVKVGGDRFRRDNGDIGRQAAVHSLPVG